MKRHATKLRLGILSRPVRHRLHVRKAPQLATSPAIEKSEESSLSLDEKGKLVERLTSSHARAMHRQCDIQAAKVVAFSTSFR